MIAKTFRARTLDDARRLANNALGDDAVLLTTRRVPRRGFAGLLGGTDFEVAAMPADAPPPAAPAKPRGTLPFANDVYDADSRPRGDIGALRSELRNELRSIQGIVARTSAISPSVEAEIAALRELIEELAASSAANDAPKNGAVTKLCRDIGLEGKPAAALARAFKDGEPGEDALRDALASQLRACPWPLSGDGDKLIALVGPSGVGKTTTAAKIAARAVLEHDKTVTLICCDSFRVGAVEQISRFAELLDVPLVEARTPSELMAAIAAAKTDLVIVDTAGRNPAEGTAERALGALTKNGVTTRAVTVLLCLPASVRASDAETFAKKFACTSPTALAITKLDETCAPAGILHAIAATGLAVSVLCAGQRVPEDIAPATTGALLDALSPPKRSRAKKRNSIQELRHG